MSSIPQACPMPWPGLDAMNQLFGHCKLEAVALREGGLRAMFGSRLRADASLCGFVFDFPCHAGFAVPHGHYLLCHVHQVGADSWCAGMPLRSGTTMIVLPGSSGGMLLGAHSLVSVLMAPLHDGVLRAFEKNPVSFGLMGRKFSIFGPECVAGTPWRFRCDSAFHALVHAGTDADSADELIEALLDPRMLDGLAAHAQEPALSYRAHYRAFCYAVDFMQANLHRDIYLDELARAAGLSERALRYTFADLLGVSPTRYLALLRLHEASRRLFVAVGGHVSVKAVAMSCGWWDLSRFAAHYRRAFGEHPSDTLLRTSSIA